MALEPTWRPRGLSKSVTSRVISTITPIRIPIRAFVTLLITYLLSPPTFQVTSQVSHILLEDEKSAAEVFAQQLG